MEIFAEPNKEKNGLSISNEYNRARLFEWLKKYPRFKITPIVEESLESRGYLEGAVIPTYCRWQYGIDPRTKGMSETRRYLFKKDFNSEIFKNREGNPELAPVSSKGKARIILDNYTRYAEENGAPIPNPDLYKLYKKEFSLYLQWPTFYDWLEELGIEEDSMPSKETIDKVRDDLNRKKQSIKSLEMSVKMNYPDDYKGLPTI